MKSHIVKIAGIIYVFAALYTLYNVIKQIRGGQ
jgi:hypothetical protein